MGTNPGVQTPITVDEYFTLLRRGVAPEEADDICITMALGLRVLPKATPVTEDVVPHLLVGPHEDGQWLVGRPGVAGQRTATYRIAPSGLVLDLRSCFVRQRLGFALNIQIFSQVSLRTFGEVWQVLRPGLHHETIAAVLTDLVDQPPPVGLYVLQGLANVLLGRCAMEDVAVVIAGEEAES